MEEFNFFNDPKELKKMERKHKELELQAVREGRSVSEILAAERQEIEKGIEIIILEEMEYNKKTELGENGRKFEAKNPCPELIAV